MKTIKYAFRFLKRAKTYTVINLIGLSFSLACCMVLARYVHRELTVDTHCVDRDKVYAVDVNTMDSHHLGFVMSDNDSVILDPSYVQAKAHVITYAQDYVMEGSRRFPVRAVVADSVYMQLFRYEAVKGAARLQSPQSVLLMEDFAQKVFGSQNPIGKVLKHSNGREMTVEGVIRRPVNKSSFNTDIILSIDLLPKRQWDRMYREFYMFRPGVDIADMNAIGRVPRNLNNSKFDKRQYTFSFIPMREVYWQDTSLGSSDETMWERGHRSHLLILEAVGLLLLLTGLLNFVNLYFITMVKRGRGYALRKVFGAGRLQLFSQIYTENFLLIAASLLFAWLWQALSVSYVDQWLGGTGLLQPFNIVLSVGILFLLPLFTSLYPYFRYSRSVSLTAVRSDKNTADTVRTRMFFLGIQYALTFLLIVLSLYFNKQLNLLSTADPGFRTHGVILAKLLYESNDNSSYTLETIMQRRQRVRTIDEKLNACPDIISWESNYSSFIDPIPLRDYIGKDGKEAALFTRVCSASLFDIYDLKFVEGGIPKGRSNVTIVNRAGLKALGYESLEEAMVTEKTPMFSRGGTTPSGVVEDCYRGHLSAGKQPMVFFVMQEQKGDLYQIACVPGRQQAVIEYLHKMEYEAYGTEHFDYTLVEDKMDSFYEEDRTIAAVYSLFAIIAIIISSMGLFGISLFDIRQRYREIGIRKVNGAKVKDIWRLLFRKYAVVLVVSFVVAVPVCIILIRQYTQDFAVKAPMGIGIFLLALVLVSLVSLGTLFWQVNRAARINPAEVIKSE